jgi:hypothetical protein
MNTFAPACATIASPDIPRGTALRTVTVLLIPVAPSSFREAD